MHWIVQKNIFKPDNYTALIGSLERLGVPHTSVAIPNGTLDLTPDVDPPGNVYVCGAIKLAKIAAQRGWVPGSFLNDQFSFDLWLKELGGEMLNADITLTTLKDAVARPARFFIRPLEDNKAFDGMLMDAAMLAHWQRDPAKAHLQQLQVIVSAAQTIYREYRLFIVKNDIVTGSVYKVAGRPATSEQVEDYVLDYARAIIGKWMPAESCVIDIGLVDGGPKVIEFNNINSSGFYACDVLKYVDAVQTAYA